MPAFGPRSNSIAQNSKPNEIADYANLPFDVVNISAASLPLVIPPHGQFPAAFLQQAFRTEEETIQVADVLEIRIWESAQDGLFASSGQRETALKATVSNAGMIEIPYGGRVRAHGRTLHQLRAVLLKRYRGQAIEPEISISILATASRTATVLGAVRTPARAVIPSKGIRLLDLLAQTGGTPHPNWEVQVVVQRGALSSCLMLQEIVDRTSNNITIIPGDTVHVTHRPRRFPVYGATLLTGSFEVPVVQPSLSALLAEAKGLNDMLAEATSVFVFRQPSADTAAEPPAPVAYRFDFAKPDAFILADRFKLSPSDIVYVATADASEFRKFVTTILSPIFGTVSNVRTLGN